MNELQPLAVKPKQGGYTLVELAIAIAILAVLIVAGLTGVQSILISGKVNDQIKATSKLASKVSLLSNATSGALAGTTTASLATLGGWDSSRVDSSGNVTNSFGTKEIGIANTTAISGMQIAGGIINTVQGVPTSACADYANGVGNIVYAIHIDKEGTTFAESNFTSSSAKPPGSNLSLANLATQCAKGTGGKVDFYMALKP